MSDVLKFIDPSVLVANLGSLTGPKELFIMLFVLFVFLYGMSIGKTRAMLSLLSIYVAFALTNIFPFTSEVTDAVPANFKPYLFKASLFSVLYILVFLVLHHSSLKRVSMGEMSMGKVFVISAIQIGFIGAVIASFLPTASAQNFLGPAYQILGSSLALFAWSAVSLGILPLMKDRRR